MKIGMMNHPAFPLMNELQYAAENHFDFIDFTFEPPYGVISESDLPFIKEFLESNRLEMIGHTAYYLPIAFPFPSIATATQVELIRQMDIFSRLGVQKMTVHLLWSYPYRFFNYQNKIQLWMDAFTPLAAAAQNRNLQLMIENVSNSKEMFRILRELLRNFPMLGFHLDVGHANLGAFHNRTDEFLKKFKKRLSHIHLSDNLGRDDDLHLPMGAGTIPWTRVLRAIKRTGYDDTFTLEVFSDERSYLLHSREILRNIWNSL